MDESSIIYLQLQLKKGVTDLVLSQSSMMLSHLQPSLDYLTCS